MNWLFSWDSEWLRNLMHIILAEVKIARDDNLKKMDAVVAELAHMRRVDERQEGLLVQILHELKQRKTTE